MPNWENPVGLEAQDTKRGGTHRKWQGHAVYAHSPTLCQRRGGVCRGAHRAVDGCMRKGLEITVFLLFGYSANY